MLDFAYYSPTRVFFGKDSLDNLAPMLKKYNATKILLHYGGGSIKKNGIYDKIINVLKEANIPYVELGGVKPNPRLELIYEGIELCRREGVDFILAVGGASTIDSGKGIAGGVKYDGDVWEYYVEKRRFTDSLPVGVVLTIPAAGSETSGGTVVTDEKNKFKRYTGGECLIPKFAILNPEFSMSLPAYQTACGVSDILAHLMERYFTNVTYVDLTDRMIEGAIRTILYHGPIVMKDPMDYNARAEIMWTGTLAHNNILNTGRLGDWGSHDVSHELSGFYDLAHGASLSIIFPAWMKYVYKEYPTKLVQFAQRAFDVDLSPDRTEDIILKMIERLESFYKDMGLPIRLSDIGIDDSNFEEMADSAMKGRTHLGAMKKLYKEDIVNIYKLAL